MAISYIRLLSTIPHPGYVEKGIPTSATPVKPPQEAPPQHNIQASCTSTQVQEGSNQSGNKPRTARTPPQDPPVTILDVKAILSGEMPPPPGLERFYSKDVFACDANGLPVWCGVCNNWKPDRSHHSSDVGRCVFKMDHFCPWVGGVVAENNFNFFIQFLCYAALYTLFDLIVMAIFFAETKQNVSCFALFLSIGYVHVRRLAPLPMTTTSQRNEWVLELPTERLCQCCMSADRWI